MARWYRRRQRGQRPRSYTWQSYHAYTENSTVAAGAVEKGILGITTPGVGAIGSVRAFDAPHTLERIRGANLHEGAGGSSDEFFYSVAALRVPAEFASLMQSQTAQEDIIDITNNLEGDDYLWFSDHFCGAPIADNVHVIDNKGKRKFDVGDVLAWVYRIYNQQQTTVYLNHGVNVRLLWRLRN